MLVVRMMEWLGDAAGEWGCVDLYECVFWMGFVERDGGREVDKFSVDDGGGGGGGGKVSFLFLLLYL